MACALFVWPAGLETDVELEPGEVLSSETPSSHLLSESATDSSASSSTPSAAAGAAAAADVPSFHFNRPIERGFFFAKSRPSSTLTNIDSNTSDPSLTSRILSLTGLSPLATDATDDVRRSDLATMLTRLHKHGVEPAQVLWIARAADDPSTAYVQLSSDATGLRKVIDRAGSQFHPLFRLATWQSDEVVRWWLMPLGRVPQLCARHFATVDGERECKSQQGCSLSHKLEDFARAQLLAAEADLKAAKAKEERTSAMKAETAAAVAGAGSVSTAPSVCFHFSEPLERGLMFAETGACSNLVAFDGATSSPALTQRILVLSGLAPLHPDVDDPVRRSDLHAMVRDLRGLGIDASSVRWIARSSTMPDTAFAQLHPNTVGIGRAVGAAKNRRNRSGSQVAHWQQFELDRWKQLVGPRLLLCEREFITKDAKSGCILNLCRFSHEVGDFVEMQQEVAAMDAAAATAAAAAATAAKARAAESQRREASVHRGKSEERLSEYGSGGMLPSADARMSDSRSRRLSSSSRDHSRSPRRRSRSPERKRGRSRSRSRERDRNCSRDRYRSRSRSVNSNRSSSRRCFSHDRRSSSRDRNSLGRGRSRSSDRNRSLPRRSPSRDRYRSLHRRDRS